MAVLELDRVRDVRLHALEAIASGAHELWVLLPPDRAVTIGRTHPVARGTPHLEVRDGNVARRHAELAPRGGGWFVRDLMSAGGTFINRRRHKANEPPYKLRDGDVLNLGDTPVRFHAAEPELASADPTERGLLAAIRDRIEGSEEVYLDWLEQQGHAERAELLRLVRMLEPVLHPAFTHEHEVVRRDDLARRIDASWRLRLAAARLRRG